MRIKNQLESLKRIHILEGNQIGIDFTQKAVKSLKILIYNTEEILLLTQNNGKPEFYKILK